MIKFFVPACVAGLFFVSSPAFAGIMPAGPAVEILPGGGWRMLQPTSIASIPASTRSWEMAGPGMQAVSKITLAGKAGPLPVNVTRVIPWGLLGNAIARSLPIVGAISAVNDLAQAIRMQQVGSDWMVDPGTDPSIQTRDAWVGYSSADSQKIVSSSPSSTCSAIAADWGNKLPGGSASVVDVSISNNYFEQPGDSYICRINYTWPSGSYGIATTTISKSVESYNGCPSIPNGAIVIEGSDGRCPTGRYDVPASVYLPENVHKVPSAVLKSVVESLDSRSENFYPPDAQLPAISGVSGPSSQTGQPVSTTTTTDSGNKTVTTTPVYNYTYSGDTITYNITETTITNNTQNGQTTTETTTTTKPADKGMCDLYPDALACAKLGEVKDSAIAPIIKNVDISPEDVALPSGCPADLALPGGRVVSYASACDAAQKMRPLVIAAGVFSALLIAVAAIRGNG